MSLKEGLQQLSEIEGEVRLNIREDVSSLVKDYKRQIVWSKEDLYRPGFFYQRRGIRELFKGAEHPFMKLSKSPRNMQGFLARKGK